MGGMHLLSVVSPGDSHSRRFDAYTKAAEQITIAQATLMTPTQAGPEIDRILTDCIKHVSTDCPPSTLQVMDARRHALFTLHFLQTSRLRKYLRSV
jgi:hypothetical protein